MLKSNGLSIVLVALFLFSMGGQAVTGWKAHNQDQVDHGRQAVGFTSYLGTGHFLEATGENWESEFLQMALFVLLTTFLYQKGSAESKRPDTVEEVDLDPRRFSNVSNAPWPVRRGGWILRIYENSLGLAFVLLFLFSLWIHAVGGLQVYNEGQLAHGRPTVSFGEFVAGSQFWFESFQNWQSEFLSLAAMVVGTIFLRQRGSAESKPVHTPHADTGRA
jgi:hypothetical protein